MDLLFLVLYTYIDKKHTCVGIILKLIRKALDARLCVTFSGVVLWEINRHFLLEEMKFKILRGCYIYALDFFPDP